MAIAGPIVVLTVVLLNTTLYRFIPWKLRVFLPSSGWFFLNLAIARGPMVWYTCSLAIQGVFSTILFMALQFKSDLVTRAFLFPFVVTASAVWAHEFIPPLGGWSTAALALLQLWNIVGGLVMLGCYPGNIMQVLEKQEMRNHRVKAIARNLVRKKDKAVEVRAVPSLDGKMELQTLVVKQTYETSRWVIYCGGNAEFLENTINDIHVIADAVKAHAILYNPRGIGYSTGIISQLGDLVEDAAAVARAYVEKEKIEEKSLMFFGHSIGAGAAAEVVAHCYPQASLVVDRSFSSMSDTAVSFSYLTPKATRKLFPWFVGDLRTTDSWDAIKHHRKLVLYSKEDEIIKFDVASLARLPQFQAGGADAEKMVELRGTPASYHNCLLNAYDNYDEVAARLNKLFGNTKKD